MQYFGKLLFKQAIPIYDTGIHTGSYHTIPVDINHHLYDELLATAYDYGIRGRPYYYQESGNPPYNTRISGSLKEIWLRRSVLEKLSAVNKLLHPLGMEVFLLDGYRSIETQRGLWTYFEDFFTHHMPGQSDKRIRLEVLKFVSNPQAFREDNENTWPGHTSGAAVDLALCDSRTGNFLDMGAHFDQMDHTAHTGYYERELAAGRIPDNHPPLIHRRILYNAMRYAGFVNYPLEYWHFDWGNQMYIANYPKAEANCPNAAWYGYCQPPART